MSDGTQVQTDASQDELIQVNQETLNKLMKWMESSGDAPDLRPQEWKDREPGPIPFTDKSLTPVFLVSGHLVQWSKGRYVDACCPIPPAPFNPYWGIKDHPNEGIGIMMFSKKKHTEFILDHAYNTKSIRLERIAEVIRQQTAAAHVEDED